MCAAGGRHRFSPVMDYLAGLQTAGRTGMLEMVRQFIGLYSQRGLLIIISDFLDDDGCERALHHLADFGHELLLVQVWAEEDRNPPWTGELDLADAESGAKLKIQVDEEARARYTRQLRRIRRNELQRADIAATRADTSGVS